MKVNLSFNVTITRLAIPPMTWVRATQNVKTLLKIKNFRDNKTKSYVKRFRAYQEWKNDLRALANEQGIVLERIGTAVYFFVGMPVTWRKGPRKKFHHKHHTSKPDLSNLLKALEDGIMPKRDQIISNYSGLAKFWVDVPPEQGWIEIHTGLPYFDPEHGYVNSEQYIPPRNPELIARPKRVHPEQVIDCLTAEEFNKQLKEGKIKTR